jgi:predicted AAA+ superfamily ATPase
MVKSSGQIFEFLQNNLFFRQNFLVNNLFFSYYREHLKLVWDKVPFEIGTRIKYSKICGINTRSNDISKAFDLMHEAMLIERVFPTTHISLPLIRKPKSSPKTVYLDIGLCVYILNLTRDQIKEKLLNPLFSGSLFEQFTGQELLALNFRKRENLYFWIREEHGTCSELDYLVQIENKLIPIEVKSASHGSLKSLHQFISRSSTNFGVRIYTGPLKLEHHSVTLPLGKTLNYRLLSIPFYLIFRLPEISIEFD